MFAARLLIPAALAGVMLGCGAILLVDSETSHPLLIGIVLGTLMGQTTVAASWCALGPGPLVWRAPLSLVWVAVLLLALWGNIAFYTGPDGSFTLIFGACLYGQWLLLQIPLWCLATAYQLKVAHVQPGQAAPDHWRPQFQIRQLLILTAVIAVIIGTGRLIASNWSEAPFAQLALVFATLAGVAIVLSLPLVLAALLPRYALPAVLLVLAVAGLATRWENPLLQLVDSGTETSVLLSINSFTAAWVLAFVALARLCGYGLAGVVENQPAQND